MKALLIASLAWFTAPAPSVATRASAPAPCPGLSRPGLSRPGPAQPDGLRRERLPADVDFVVHLDLEGLKRTELWKHASEAGEHFDLDELDDFQEEFGLDPLTDIRAVTLYKVQSEEEPTVVLFSSTDKVDQALARLKKEKGYRRLVEAEIELHTFGLDDGEETMYAYVHSAGDERVVVLAGESSSALRAARVLRGQDVNHEKAGQLLTLAPEKGSFLYLAAAQLPELDEFPPASQVFGLAQGIQVDLGEAGGFLRGHMGLTTQSYEDALNISNVLNGLVSLARLAGNEVGEAIELLTGLRLATRGSEVTVDFEYEVERLLELLRGLEGGDAEEPQAERAPKFQER